MHELSEQTKRVIDLGAFTITGLAGAAQAATLSNVALVVTIGAGLLSAAWTAMRFYDRIRYGRGAAS
jgi:hypothetical protein